jgi:hypothetical protein
MREHEKHPCKGREESWRLAGYLLKGGYYSDAVRQGLLLHVSRQGPPLREADVILRSHRGVISQFGLESVKKGFIEESYGHALAHAKGQAGDS